MADIPSQQSSIIQHHQHARIFLDEIDETKQIVQSHTGIGIAGLQKRSEDEEPRSPTDEASPRAQLWKQYGRVLSEFQIEKEKLKEMVRVERNAKGSVAEALKRIERSRTAVENLEKQAEQIKGRIQELARKDSSGRTAEESEELPQLRGQLSNKRYWQNIWEGRHQKSSETAEAAQRKAEELAGETEKQRARVKELHEQVKPLRSEFSGGRDT